MGVSEDKPGNSGWVVERAPGYPAAIEFSHLATAIKELHKDGLRKKSLRKQELSTEEAGKKGISEEDFEKLNVATVRWSAYFGFAIGGLTCSSRPGFEKRSDRGFNYAGKCYSVNDFDIESGYVSPSVISNLPALGAEGTKVATYVQQVCSASVRALLAELPAALRGRHVRGLWQCNVNLYSAGNPLHWHRDDRDRIVDGVPCASCDTFHPVSGTYIVPSAPGSQAVCGLDVAHPAKAEDVLPSKPPLRTDDGQNFFFGYDRRHKAPVVKDTYNKTPDGTKIVILKEGAYTHGVHTFNGGQAQHTSERMSFNFRLVRQEAWADLYRPEKLAVAA